VAVTICVPRGNNPEKNEAVRGLGATLIEEGRDYDESIAVAERLVEERGLRMIHSTNDRDVIAGAATLTLEMIEQEELDAIVFAIGGGSQAVGGLVVARALRPSLEVYGVQAAGASAIHDSWHASTPDALRLIAKPSADTFADGLATRNAYPLTLGALRAKDGLRDFITVRDGQIAAALSLMLQTTHNLAEGAGAAGLAGLMALRERLANKRVGVVLSGSNIDAATLKAVLNPP
jgi:threonine dehydratase